MKEIENMKFAKCLYGSFDNNQLGLKMVRNDVFIVTDEIEKSQVYQDGIATKNFVPATIGNAYQLDSVVNITDELRAEFKKQNVPKPVPVVKEAEPEPEPVDEVEEATTDTVEIEPAISFTEEAGNVKNAVAAIRKCDDMDSLKLAKKLDERKTVQKALDIRIEELEG